MVLRARCGKSRGSIPRRWLRHRQTAARFGLVHLHAGTAMIDLVDVNGQLEKGGDAPGSSPAKCRSPLACASILSTKTNCWPICDAGSPSILLESRTARKATGRRFTSDPDGNRIELKGPAAD
ncbi:hypothetical protein M8494_31050 [Serratia ureilytica]